MQQDGASRWIEDTDGHLLAARLKFSAFDALPKQMRLSLWSEHISKYSLVADGYVDDQQDSTALDLAVEGAWHICQVSMAGAADSKSPQPAD